MVDYASNLAQAAEENRRRGFGVAMERISMFDKNPPRVDFLVVDEAQYFRDFFVTPPEDPPAAGLN